MHITRNTSFYTLYGRVEPNTDPDGHDISDEKQKTYDIRSKKDMVAYVRSDHGRMQLRDSKDGMHQYILVPEKSGFIFVPNGDQEEAIFVSQYKSPRSRKALAKMQSTQTYKGLEGKQLKISAQIYMLTYNAQLEAFNNTSEVQEIRDKETLRIYLAIGVLKQGEELADVTKTKIDAWAWDVNQKQDNKVFGRFLREEGNEKIKQMSSPQNQLEAYIDKTVETECKKENLTHFAKVTINPLFQNARGYKSLRSVPRIASGTRLKVSKEAWSSVSKLILPDSGQNPDGEKAYAYETMGRGV